MWDLEDSPEFDAFFWRVIDCSIGAGFAIAILAWLAGVLVRAWLPA